MNKKIMLVLIALNFGSLNASAPQADGKAKAENEVAENKPAKAAKKEPVLVKLPSAKVLGERLQGLRMAHFMEKTGLHEDLGDQERYAVGVAIAVEMAYSEYDNYFKKSGVQSMMGVINLVKDSLIKAILKDSPEAIAELVAAKLIK